VSDEAACAHLGVSHIAQAVDPDDPTRGVRSWWECDSKCGTRFSPVNGSFIAMIHATCQYSKLVEIVHYRNQDHSTSLFSKIFLAITDTAKEWHTKPGAVYVGHDDYIDLDQPTINKVPVGIAKIPKGYFLLTDGQELMD